MQNTTRHPPLKIRSPKLMNNLFTGNFKAAFHGKGIEFRDFREYSSSDDARYIDWLTSSREQSIIMRRYQEEKEGNILCIIDVSPTLASFENKKIQCIKNIITLLAHASRSVGEAFGGSIVYGEKNIHFPARRDFKNEILLKKFSPHSEKYIPLKIDFLLSPMYKRSLVFILSESFTPDMQSLKKNSLKHDVIYIHISHSFENTLEGEGIQYVGAEKKSVYINLDDDTKTMQYKQARQKKIKDFSNALHAIGVDSIFVDESDSLLSKFLSLMKQREGKR